ncbi:MAG: response regulator [Alphaproteobacteria bacterium]
MDPNCYMRDLCLDMLRSLRFKDAWGCASPDEALARMRDNGADILVVDYKLPNMNGIDFATSVRTGENTPDPFVPMIMMTEYATLDIVHSARDAGINEFLAKPVSPKAFLDRLVECLIRPRQFIAAPQFFGPDRRRRSDRQHPSERRRDAAVAIEQSHTMLFDKKSMKPVVRPEWMLSA